MYSFASTVFTQDKGKRLEEFNDNFFFRTVRTDTNKTKFVNRRHMWMFSGEKILIRIRELLKNLNLAKSKYFGSKYLSLSVFLKFSL